MGRRSGVAWAAIARRAPVMKDRRTPRGGQRNEQSDLLEEAGEEDDMIVRTPVTSRNLLEVGHDPISQQLEVVFRAAPHLVYTYTGVGVGLYDGLMAAESLGEYFNLHIRSRPDLYQYTRRKA